MQRVEVGTSPETVKRQSAIINWKDSSGDRAPSPSQEAILSYNTAEQAVEVSVVIPLFNEVENLELLYTKLRNMMDGLDRRCEVILIDDGSADGSIDLLREIEARDEQIKVIQLRRNFGQAAAFSAGFDHSRGDVIITMDGDLQNDPADIPLLLEKVDEGYDIVSGWRVKRQDKFISRRLPSQMANWLISRVTGVKLHDYGCSLKAYRREVVESTKLYGELHRFIPALASWMGVRITEVPVNHSPRKFGKSKYGLNRTVRVILDLLTVKFLLDFATRPIQIFGLLGLLCFGGGTVTVLYLSVLRLVYHQPIGDRRPLLLLAVLFVVIGVQLIIMGLLGELVIRTYHEAQNKPIYVIREIVARKNQ
jgi:glycosyltransferase involved in cell wall biosynthesis